jgi:tetratricopeptide (TPR) repeat protein
MQNEQKEILKNTNNKAEKAAKKANTVQSTNRSPEAHNNLGVEFSKLGKLDDAVTSFHKALALKPDYAKAHYNLGLTLQNLGKLDEAVASYRKAIVIKPDYAEAHNNLGVALRNWGKLDEAVRVLQTALEKIPGNKLITDRLIKFLNYHTPIVGTRDAYARAQEVLQQVIFRNIGSSTITDEAVQQLYQQCHDILRFHKLSEQSFSYQLWRGEVIDIGCDRHKVVFDTFKAIPEYCFGCFKVSIKPRTVVELFKLMLVFDRLELENDNTRKCFVEVRPEISGTYTGLIYCKSFDEGKKILNIVQAIVGGKISEKIPVSVKRGCSEFPIAFPEYAHIGDDGTPMMTYKEEWREHEVYTDKNLIGHIYPLVFDTHNHSGATLHDAVVMRTWLAYAATIGDFSYLKISKEPMRDLPIKKRPPFQPVEDK